MLSVVQIAKICFDADRAYNLVVFSHVGLSWEDCLQRIRTRTIEDVRYLLDNPDMPASIIHERWVRDQKKSGWLFGTEFDRVKKLDPLVCHFNRLPPEQHERINLFGLIVRSLSAPRVKRPPISDTATTLLEMLLP